MLAVAPQGSLQARRYSFVPVRPAHSPLATASAMEMNPATLAGNSTASTRSVNTMFWRRLIDLFQTFSA